MDRSLEQHLIDFCLEQRADPDAVHWHRMASEGMPAKQLAAAAWLLSSTGWYGHRERMLQIAASLTPPGVTAAQAVLASGMDPTRLCSMIRHRAQAAARGERSMSTPATLGAPP